MKNMKAVVSGTFRKAVLASVIVAAPAVGGFVITQVAPEQTFFTAGSVQAQVTPGALRPNPDPVQPRRVPAQGQRLATEVQKVMEFLEPEEGSGREPDLDRAYQTLNNAARDMDSFNPNEKAMIYQIYASIYFNRENIPKVIESFENVLAQSPDIAVSLEAQVTYSLGQLYLQEDQPAKALDLFKRWTKLTNTITADQYFFIGQTFYTNDDHAGARANVLEAIRIYEADGRIPKEEWLAFMRAVYFFQEDYQSTLDVVIQLVRHYPKMSYWKQLASLYYELGRLDDYYRALDTVYVMGGLDRENDLMSLAGFFLDNEAPYKAAKIIDKGMNQDKIIDDTGRNLETLANSWRMAQERDKALVEMQRAAAKADDGELFFNLARLLFAEGRYDDAVRAARNALNKGGVQRVDNVYITIGQAEIERGNFDEAEKALKEAAKDERSRRVANQWINYAGTEKTRREALKNI